jgi:hypothetical protein
MANTLPSAEEVTYLADWILHGHDATTPEDTDTPGEPPTTTDIAAAISDAQTPVAAVAEALATVDPGGIREPLRSRAATALLAWLHDHHRLVGPQPGETITDGERSGVLRACRVCAGEGVLLDDGDRTYGVVTVPDPIPQEPTDQ